MEQDVQTRNTLLFVAVVTIVALAVVLYPEFTGQPGLLATPSERAAADADEAKQPEDAKIPSIHKEKAGPKADDPKPTEVAEADLVTTESGLKYFDLTVGEGELPEDGGLVEVHYTGWLDDGTVFDTSSKRNRTFKFPLGQGRVIKGWDEGVATMKVGGKRQLVIPADLAYGDRRTGKIPPGSQLTFEVELVSVSAPRVAPEAPQSISEFETTESGLKIHVMETGDGPQPAEGDVVLVDYTGWLEADGTKFDSSLDRNEPISFPLGKGRVIKGWDEGVGMLNVGSSAQLVIPADLAYGERGRPPVIPANSTLIFEVELVGIKGQ